jgi:hypothetical protein
MNTKKISMKTCLALSALITVLMGVAGCGLLKFVTAEAKAEYVNRPGVEVVGGNIIETGLEPIDSPKVPSQTEQSPSFPKATPIIGDDEAIRAALGARLRVDGDALMIFVEENTGRHARGRVDNGYFLAAKVGKQWMIMADGQGMPDCDKVARYGFPISMVPECELPSDRPADSDQDAIRAALAAHFEMDESEFYHFEVKENTGLHAKGGVDNGYFLAAKVDGQWVFVDGGQSAPNCNEVAKYGFPASMVPECPTGGSNAPDCPRSGTTVATFITDVTYPDGSIVSPGSSFIKTWRIKNVGTCAWDENYQVIFVSGDKMNGPAFKSLTNVNIQPGNTLDVSIALTAPETPGTYRGNWKLRAPNGEIFGLTTGNPFWVEVEVKAIE